MRKPKNRMAEVETQEQVPDHISSPVSAGGECPVCKNTAAIVSERMASNRVIRQYRCEKCDVFFTREE